MWNKVLLGTFTEPDTIVNISTDNFENLIGLYEESQFTITSGSNESGNIILSQNISDFGLSDSSGAIYYIAGNLYTAGTYKNKNYIFFTTCTDYGIYDYGMKQFFVKHFMASTSNDSTLIYDPSSSNIKFSINYNTQYCSNVTVKLYGLYEK